MQSKLLLLKSGETIISEVKELVLGEQVYGYLLTNPQKVFYDNTLFAVENSSSTENPSVKVTLSSWIILTNDKDILISKDWVVTVVNPVDSLHEMYLEQVNGSTD